jgi:hypothetical protein
MMRFARIAPTAEDLPNQLSWKMVLPSQHGALPVTVRVTRSLDVFVFDSFLFERLGFDECPSLAIGEFVQGKVRWYLDGDVVENELCLTASNMVADAVDRTVLIFQRYADSTWLNPHARLEARAYGRFS